MEEGGRRIEQGQTRRLTQRTLRTKNNSLKIFSPTERKLLEIRLLRICMSYLQDHLLPAGPCSVPLAGGNMSAALQHYFPEATSILNRRRNARAAKSALTKSAPNPSTGLGAEANAQDPHLHLAQDPHLAPHLSTDSRGVMMDQEAALPSDDAHRPNDAHAPKDEAPRSLSENSSHSYPDDSSQVIHIYIHYSIRILICIYPYIYIYRYVLFIFDTAILKVY